MKEKSTQLAAFAAAFAVIALFRQSDVVLYLDRSAYYVAMQLSYSRAWLLFWETISVFGRGEFVYALVAIAGIRFLWLWRRATAAAYVLGMTVLFLLNPLFKILWQLDRPVSLSPFSELGTYTFPSGHAFNSVILCYFLPRFLDWTMGEQLSRVYLSRVVLFGGVLLIGASRVFLGMHWLFDVVGGWALGTMAALLLLAWLKRFERTNP